MKTEKILLIITIAVILVFSMSLSALAQPPSPTSDCAACHYPKPTYVFLNFEGDPNFPSVTVLRDTAGLSRFTGSAFRLTPVDRNNVVNEIVSLVREDYKDFNVEIVEGLTAGLGIDYYTWGIDDTAYVYVDLNSDVKTIRLYGKAGGNPSTGQGEHPRHARTWAGSFTLLPGVDLNYFAIIFIFPCGYDEWGETYGCHSILDPYISYPPYVIPFESIREPWALAGTYTEEGNYVYIPIIWQPSFPPLIPYVSCTPEEHICGQDKWFCGKFVRFGGCIGLNININHVVQALANNAAHEISHLFGSYDLTLDANGGVIHPVSGNVVPAGSQKTLMFSQDEWIEATTNKSFDTDNYQILMNFLGPAPPENPEITSPTHSKGQPSCEQALTVEWETPYAVRGVGGYSYTIVDQEDPYYDVKRTPDDIIDLNASTTSFTTPPLEPGHLWEFNIKTIDSGGLPARYYASFWVDIVSCSITITSPRSGDTFHVGDVGRVLWDPTVTYGGDGVGAGYDVESIDLFKGPDFIRNLKSNLLNSGDEIFLVPDVDPGSDYRIRLILGRNSTGDMFPELPERFIGFSNFFTIRAVTIPGDLDGDNDVDQKDVNILLSFRNKPASACPACDLDGDGMVTALDARKLVLLCTRPRCATQ